MAIKDEDQRGATMIKRDLLTSYCVLNPDSCSPCRRGPRRCRQYPAVSQSRSSLLVLRIGPKRFTRFISPRPLIVELSRLDGVHKVTNCRRVFLHIHPKYRVVIAERKSQKPFLYGASPLAVSFGM